MVSLIFGIEIVAFGLGRAAAIYAVGSSSRRCSPEPVGLFRAQVCRRFGSCSALALLPPLYARITDTAGLKVLHHCCSWTALLRRLASLPLSSTR
jgi:hypothetical protein